MIELLARVPSSELTEWMAYYLLADDAPAQTKSQQVALLKAASNG